MVIVLPGASAITVPWRTTPSLLAQVIRPLPVPRSVIPLPSVSTGGVDTPERDDTLRSLELVVLAKRKVPVPPMVCVPWNVIVLLPCIVTVEFCNVSPLCTMRFPLLLRVRGDTTVTPSSVQVWNDPGPNV